MAELGTLEELPQDYRDAMAAAGVAPLWPMMRNVLPHGRPTAVTRPGYWNYDRIRPLLLRAGELTPVEKAERRVLVLSDPGRGTGAMQATASIYLGLQLLLPGETAPAHVHTPSAVRIVVEGSGGFTVVDGEKLPMEEGDLVLTPGGEWHDHGHEGERPGGLARRARSAAVLLPRRLLRDRGPAAGAAQPARREHGRIPRLRPCAHPPPRR